jgi:hypothetical protein
VLYLCQFTWQPHVSAQQIAQRFLEIDQSGIVQKDTIRGWYTLVGGGAGVLIVETDDPAELTQAMTAWMDLVSWDVRAVVETSYDQQLALIQEQLQQ